MRSACSLASTQIAASVTPSLLGTDRILLPLPRGSSGNSETGNTSSRPSVDAAASSVPDSPTGVAGTTEPPGRHAQRSLAGFLARVQLGELHDEPIAGRRRNDPPILGRADQHGAETGAVGRIEVAR